MNRILLLCEGNICRSPMAACLFATDSSLIVDSAGLNAPLGRPADPIAVRLMSEHGLDLSSHRSKPLSKALCTQSDLILVMEKSQLRALTDRIPTCRGRTYQLRDGIDVSDPFQQGEQAFRDSLAHILVGVEQWRQKMDQIRKVGHTK